ncbi:head-tail connector protein [Sphingosinicella humi]|uniref:Phage gp6-like head-tail connector protein n=1 Tax=Allosphingosinicella humi TaxID=2068657 RepID=A0A2U2J0I1_9SPHN|nr:head-tail connector protein [Sphingosinicella humi]PWG01839.1 hypothetical protein DF286_02330 [Sphingosinicella humi]
MISGDPLVPGAEALGEAKAYLRVEGSDEDAMLERLIGSAAELCERFVRQALLRRGFSETLELSGAWTRLGVAPVQAISGVEGVRSDGSAFAISAEAYAIDIDAHGEGWVRVSQAGDAVRIKVAYQAGLAADWASLPEALRQGMVRLTAHLFTHRDGPGDAGPPAAVTALWRPWRRMRIG